MRSACEVQLVASDPSFLYVHRQGVKNMFGEWLGQKLRSANDAEVQQRWMLEDE